MQPVITYRGVVFAWHCDHFGHMNNVWYGAKFDEASWNFIAQLGFTPSYFRDSGYALVAAEQNTKFKRELLAGDVLEVRSEVLEVREKSMRFMHRLYNAETGIEAASCEIVAVHFDKQARKSAPLPVNLRAAAQGFIGDQPQAA